MMSGISRKSIDSFDTRKYSYSWWNQEIHTGTRRSFVSCFILTYDQNSLYSWAERGWSTNVLYWYKRLLPVKRTYTSPFLLLIYMSVTRVLCRQLRDQRQDLCDAVRQKNVIITEAIVIGLVGELNVIHDTIQSDQWRWTPSRNSSKVIPSYST